MSPIPYDRQSPAGDTGPVERVYRRHDLPVITGYSVGYCYALIARGEFPRPVKIGHRSVWLESDIAAWQRRHIAASREVV